MFPEIYWVIQCWGCSIVSAKNYRTWTNFHWADSDHKREKLSSSSEFTVPRYWILTIDVKVQYSVQVRPLRSPPAEIRKSFSRFDCGPAKRLRPGFCRNHHRIWPPPLVTWQNYQILGGVLDPCDPSSPVGWGLLTLGVQAKDQKGRPNRRFNSRKRS